MFELSILLFKSLLLIDYIPYIVFQTTLHLKLGMFKHSSIGVCPQDLHQEIIGTETKRTKSIGEMSVYLIYFMAKIEYFLIKSLWF